MVKVLLVDWMSLRSRATLRKHTVLLLTISKRNPICVNNKWRRRVGADPVYVLLKQVAKNSSFLLIR